MVDQNGTPLSVVITGANVHDSQMLINSIDAIPNVRNGKRGRPRRRPVKLYADKGYDSKKCRLELKERGIIPRIARRGVDKNDRLGKHRWVVERTNAWLNQYRRLKIRWERRADIHLAFLFIACALICIKQLHRLCTIAS